MGRGRAPCCDKTKVRTGPWSPAEDLRLMNFIQKHGHSNWRALPKQAGLLRCGKSCRLRWINYLRPDVKRGNFTPEEEQTIIELHNSFGNKWSKIASCLPGRTDNEIKNVWNTHLKKRLMAKKSEVDCHKTEAKDSKMEYSSASSSCTSSSMTTPGDHENMEKLLGDDQAQETDQLKEKPKFTKAISSTQLQDNAPSDSPSSSSVSKFSNSRSQENRTKQALINSSKPISDEAATIPQLGDSDDQRKTDTIPVEFDVDFWELMDSLDPLQPNKTAENGDKNLSVDEKTDGEVEFGKWLRFLENELGLTSDDGDHLPINQQIMLTANANPQHQDFMSCEPELSSPALFDFSPIWPCSPPHYLGI